MKKTINTPPMMTYGRLNTARSADLMASNWSSGKKARSSVLIGLSLAWMKCMATNMPASEPMGLKAWARLRRRVAVSLLPMERM